ncbi:MAG: IS1595 family transposase [Burkholderiales bacterium]
MTSTINQPHFQDADKAREYLERTRWPHGPVCPHCGSVSKDHYALNGSAHRPGVYKCKDCRKQFTVTVGTVLERSKIPLHQWMQAVYLICSSKKGCSSHQLQRTLHVQYKTAWFMSHRLREAMKSPGGIMGSSGGTVEADETYIGRKPGTKVRRGHSHKEAVFSLVERKGHVRSFHVNDVTAEALKAKLAANVSYSATLMTDNAKQYVKLGREYADHQSVNHSADEYVRGNAHTNTVENFFSIFKRGMYGVYQHCSSHHLHRYTTEFDFRYNHREQRIKVGGKWTKAGYNDAERTQALLKGISGKRLTYKRVNAAAQNPAVSSHCHAARNCPSPSQSQ